MLNPILPLQLIITIAVLLQEEWMKMRRVIYASWFMVYL